MSRKPAMAMLGIGLILWTGCPPASPFPDCPHCGENDDADGDGITPAGGDCDDTDDQVRPGAVEVCDGVDNDCDGTVDVSAVDAQQWLADIDGDGYGDESRPTEACEAPPDTTQTPGDCDDTDAAVHPDQEEICGNGIDDDCDGGAGACDKVGEGVGLEVGDTIEAVLTGSSPYRMAGSALCPAGDLDGDGMDEWLVGSPGDSDEVMVKHGAVYIVAGRTSWPGTEAAVDDEAIASLKVNNEGVDDALGGAVACGEDVDGDGIPDLALGAPLWAGGSVFLMSGAVSGEVADIPSDAGRLATVGYFDGESTDGGLGTVILLGDVTGDAIVDLVVSAPDQDTSASGIGQGVVLVFAGPLSGTEIDVSSAEISIESPLVSPRLGNDLDAVDLDGDGDDDLIIGSADSEDPDQGRVYVVPTAALMGVVQTNDVADAVLTGEAGEFDFAGSSVRAVGDVDGDGLDDVAVGAIGRESGKGAVYLIRGPDLDGNDEIREVAILTIGGESDGDLLGSAVAGGADLTGDGLKDLAIGASGFSSGRGAVYVFHGPLDETGTLDANEAALQLEGLSADAQSGEVLSWAGDTDGDGIDDLLIGAPGHDTDDDDAGAVFLMRGSGL